MRSPLGQPHVQGLANGPIVAKATILLGTLRGWGCPVRTTRRSMR